MKIVFLVLVSSGLLFFSTCKSPTAPCNDCPTPLDTTSHAIQWRVDTLGAQGLIRDVWVLSRTSAFAVGDIYLRDSSGQLETQPYSLAVWDGQRWSLKKLYYRSTSGDTIVISDIRGIFYVTPSEIWFAAGSIFRWDGVSSLTELSFSRLSLADPNATIEKLWGTSSSNLFGVGNAGTIVRYNSTSWTKLASGTTVDLEDIWGIQASNKYLTVNVAWATGTTVSDGRCVVLQYNGSAWATIYNNQNQPLQNTFSFSSVWTDDAKVLYLTGGAKLRTMNLSDGTFTVNETGQEWISYRVRGIKHNDIFVSGAAAELSHYNLANWFLYPDLKAMNNADAFVFFRSVFPTSDFVVLGGEFFTGLNGFPVVVRGYRQ